MLKFLVSIRNYAYNKTNHKEKERKKIKESYIYSYSKWYKKNV